MPIPAQDHAGQRLVEDRRAARAIGAVQALRGVDLELGRGEWVGLVGHNGAGKSTLVSLLSGALAPDRGELRFAGRGAVAPAWSAGEARRWGLRCVFQELSLSSNLTLAENMRIPHPQPPPRPRLH